MCEGPGRSQFFDDTDTEATGGLIEQRLTVRRISRLWHKIIGRLFELKVVDGSEQRDFRLIIQIIVHMKMCISVFIIVTA